MLSPRERSGGANARSARPASLGGDASALVGVHPLVRGLASGLDTAAQQRRAADRKTQSGPIVVRPLPRLGPSDSVAHPACRRRIGVAQQNRELVAADAAWEADTSRDPMGRSGSCRPRVFLEEVQERDGVVSAIQFFRWGVEGATHGDGGSVAAEVGRTAVEHVTGGTELLDLDQCVIF